MAGDVPHLSDYPHPKNMPEALDESLAIELNVLSGDGKLIADANQTLNQMTRSERQLVFAQMESLDRMVTASHLFDGNKDPTCGSVPHVKFNFNEDGMVSSIQFDGRCGKSLDTHVTIALTPQKDSSGESDKNAIKRIEEDGDRQR